ncbi:glycosyltransferase, partial [Acinetobacter baumannii]
ANGLVARGHEVTLFAHPDSCSAGRLITWPGRSSSSLVDIAANSATLARHVIGGGYDIVHSFSRVAVLTPILPLPIPKLMTYQRPITRRAV